MGFLVMNEIFDEWKAPKGQIGPNGYSNYFDEWYERDVKNFVWRDRNHPSVVLWSAGNEIGDQQAPKGAETLRRLMDVFHSEDPTRLVTAGCDHIASEPPAETARPEFLAALEVVGYNYVNRWRDRTEKYYSIDKAAHPQWRVVGTESGAMGGVRGDYRGLCDEAPLAAAATIAGCSPKRRSAPSAADRTLTWNSCGDSSAPTTTWPATSCGRASTTLAKHAGRPRDRRRE